MKITPEQAGTTETIGCDQEKNQPVNKLLEDKQRLIKIGGIVIGVILLIVIIYHMGSTPIETTDTNQKTEVTTEATADTEASAEDTQTSEATETTEANGDTEATEAPASENTEASQDADENTEVVVETPPTTPR